MLYELLQMVGFIATNTSYCATYAYVVAIYSYVAMQSLVLYCQTMLAWSCFTLD